MRLALRWLVFIFFLALSVLLSVVGTVLFHSPFLSLFLVFPFFAFWPRKRKERPVFLCPNCDFWTTDPAFRFCPRDASPLARRAPTEASRAQKA